LTRRAAVHVTGGFDQPFDDARVSIFDRRRFHDALIVAQVSHEIRLKMNPAGQLSNFIFSVVTSLVEYDRGGPAATRPRRPFQQLPTDTRSE